MCKRSINDIVMETYACAYIIICVPSRGPRVPSLCHRYCHGVGQATGQPSGLLVAHGAWPGHQQIPPGGLCRGVQQASGAPAKPALHADRGQGPPACHRRCHRPGQAASWPGGMPVAHGAGAGLTGPGHWQAPPGRLGHGEYRRHPLGLRRHANGGLGLCG